MWQKVGEDAMDTRPRPHYLQGLSEGGTGLVELVFVVGLLLVMISIGVIFWMAE